MLDERRFEEWRDLFAEDGHYWVPLKPGQESPMGECSLFYDDRTIMATRFERLRHPEHSFARCRRIAPAISSAMW